ncbi:MAG TPA: metallohydrolase [Thermoanaerobaculia bacterium]|nr:metallohydrolase [Thermoanaerobaculia bacterium]
MGNDLLIRAYRVGCGDCIYVRIPQGKNGFHILIDCGKKGGTELLEKAIKDLETTMLPDGDAPGKKRLDLIVATHRHEDHIKGFDKELFENIQVKNIWLSAVMDPEHPQKAPKAHKLHAFASAQMRRLADSGRALSPQVEILASAYGVSNDAADDLLMKTLPEANGIEPKYVHAGMTSKQLGLGLKDATIRVLAPEQDIDHFYLGEETDTSLKGFQAVSSAARPRVERSGGPAPKNISAGDFRLLQSGMLSNGLAFAAKDTAIQNNMSVVLLIEWKKRRLLFVGDAEWEREFKEGKDNGSWNVMWEKHRETHLKDPVDFLKIGHHGSINATPPVAELQPKPKAGAADFGTASIYRMLDTLLPVPKPGKKPAAQAIVSTEREFYNPIPECAVLVDLARRVSNTRNYGAELKKKNKDPEGIWISTKAKKNKFFETYEKEFLDQPQPLRTDLEFELSGDEFIDVLIPPGT